ncbi:MAG TPA: serine/threonine-protein kinase [Vicinamibacterales bacterium]|nr:serine/threonine-protein kinase [Vicinamibacterales bacterium]
MDPLDAHPTQLGLATGALLSGRYRIERLIGAGATGEVYLAEDVELKKPRAIKRLRDVLSQDTGAVDRLKIEARTSMELAHEDIVRMFHFEAQGPIKFLVMEYVEGVSLAALLLRHRRLDDRDARRVGAQIAAALAYAHAKGVLHRDVKPANVLLGPEGTVKLADFGLAREVRDSLSRVSRLDTSGTLAYMAPEAVMGKAGPTSDWYALGATLYEMVSGAPPFSTGDIATQILHRVPDRLVGASEELAQLVALLLAKNPAERPGATQVRELLDGAAIKSEASPPSGETATRARIEARIAANRKTETATRARIKARIEANRKTGKNSTESIGPVTFDQLRGGLGVEQVIAAFFDGCNKGPDRLFVTESWMASRLPVMRDRLSSPVTSEEGELLREVVLKHIDLDRYLDWLKLDPRTTWGDYQLLLEAQHRAAEAEDVLRREAEERQAKHDEREFVAVSLAPLRLVSGHDVLDACCSAWARCEFPPMANLPGGGMGDTVLDEVRTKFASCFCAGLQAELPANRDVQSLSSTVSELGRRFDAVWQQLPCEHRRDLAKRLWRKYLWPQVSLDHGEIPGDAIGLLDLREFLKARSIRPDGAYRYEWLARKRDEAIRAATGTALVKLSLGRSTVLEGAKRPRGPILEGLYDTNEDGSPRVDAGFDGVASRAAKEKEDRLFKSQRDGSVPQGSVLRLIYKAHSGLPFGFDGWLGADLSRGDRYFYDATEDQEATIAVGASTVERILTLKSQWPKGQMLLSVAIWYGPISDTRRSVRLALAQEPITIE